MKQAFEMIWSISDIKQRFLDYNKRKDNEEFYIKDEDLLGMLKRLYLWVKRNHNHLDDLKEEFVKNYIECECILENVHQKSEQDGLKAMYEYIHSEEIDKNFDIYTLLELHRILYSKAPYPECGGMIRTCEAYIDGAAIDLSQPHNIRMELKLLEPDLQEIIDLRKEASVDRDAFIEYVKKCVVLKCKLIKIHPFFDGNGRSIRGFINKLLLDVGMPSIYISADQNKQYKQAMQKAIGEENDYDPIIKFYFYKICESIFELDISGKKDTPLFGQQMLQLAEQLKQDLKDMPISDKEWNSVFSFHIQRQFAKKNISCSVYSTSQFNESLFTHSFLVIYYQDRGKNKRLLLDPTFDDLCAKGYINLEIKDTKSECIIENMKNNGITSISNVLLGQYINLFKKREKLTEKQKTRR